MGQLVYLLCALTSIGCAVLLLRNYARTDSRLLLWSGTAFVFFALNNTVVFIDLVLVPSVDLSVLRNACSLSGVIMMLYGLICEAT